jgi:hypothetical protein
MLAQEIEDLNRDTPEDRKVKEAVIVDKPDPNQIAYEDEEGQLRYSYDDDDDDYEEDLAIRDPELFKITESNRKINIEQEEKPAVAAATRRPPELVFSDPPVLVSEDGSIQASFYYGLSEEKESKKTRRYMMMCDFGEESSFFALKWAIGTLLRDGDEVHIASIVDEDDEIEKMDKKEKKELLEEVSILKPYSANTDYPSIFIL